MDYNKEKQFAIKIVRQASKELLKYFKKSGQFSFIKKSKHEIVTPADMAANKIILAGIKRNFPSHGILSEETGWYQKKSEFLWTVDPLDGTTNFAMGLPLWGICLGLFYKKELVLGVVNLPFMKEIYWAIKDEGSYLNNKKIKVASTKKLANALTTYCYGHSDKFVHKAGLILRSQAIDARQLGSAAIETAWLAKGTTQAFMVQKVNLWDVAPGILIIREAGGKATDFKGKEWNINSKDLLASNKLIHKELLQVVDPVIRE